MASMVKSCNITYKRFLCILSIGKVLFLYNHFLCPLGDHCCSCCLYRKELFHLLPTKVHTSSTHSMHRDQQFQLILYNIQYHKTEGTFWSSVCEIRLSWSPLPQWTVWTVLLPECSPVSAETSASVQARRLDLQHRSNIVTYIYCSKGNDATQ
jgi:hypothetical protein